MKLFGNYQISILWLLLLLSGCSKTPIVQSSWYNPSRNAGQKAYEDPKERIGWIITNDENRLYVQIRFPGQKYQQLVMREGLTLYIDTLGKKKEGCSFRVRNTMDDMMPGMRRMENNGSFDPKHGTGETNPMQGEEPPRNGIDRRSPAPRNFDEAFWKIGTDETFINMRFEKTDFIAKSYMDQTGVLICMIGIPLKEFNYVNKINSRKPISIGLNLVAENMMKVGMEQNQGGRQGFRGMGGGMHGGPGGMGGGMSGGRGGMGRGPGGGEGFGGGPGGGAPGGMQRPAGNASDSSVKVWVRTILCNNNR